MSADRHDEKRLERLKKKFARIYRNYCTHLDNFDCGITIARVVSSTITTYEREMNTLLDEMSEIELRIHGAIPDALKMRFGKNAEM